MGDLFLKAEMDLMTNRRKLEVKEACRVMEEKDLFGNLKKRKKIITVEPCEVCGNFHKFITTEVNKICDSCRRDGRKPGDMEYTAYENHLANMLGLATTMAKMRFTEIIQKIKNGFTHEK